MWIAWKTARTQLQALHSVHKFPCFTFRHQGSWTNFGTRCGWSSSGEFVSVLSKFTKRGPIECSYDQMVRSVGRSMCFHFERGFASQEGTEGRGEDRDSDEVFSDDEETVGIKMEKAKGSLSSDEGLLSDGEDHQTVLEGVLPFEQCSSKSSTGEEEQPEEDGESAVFEENMGNPLDIAAEKVVGSIDHRVSGVPPLWTRVSRATRKDKKSLCLSETIEKWIEEGNEVSRKVILYILTALRRNKLYGAALQVSDWVMEKKPFELNDLDYSFRVELVSRVRGIKQAEDYFVKIPKEFLTQMAYCNLLGVYVNSSMEAKAEKLVEKAEKLGIGVSTFMYNQLLLLYRRKGKTKKMAAAVRKMDEANVQPDCFTYNTLLLLKLKKGDIKGMDEIAKKMEDDEVKPDSNTFGILAKGYLEAGLTEKAEVAMAQIESGGFSRNHVEYRVLLKLKSQMGKVDELERLWGKLLSSSSVVLLDDYLYMIEALGRVGKVERAEAIFNEMWKSKSVGRTRQYNALLSAYADQGMVVKAEELLKQMEESVGPNFMTYDHLMKMYVRLGLDQKVTEIMERIRKNMHSNTRNSVKIRPHYVTIQSAIDIFSKNGDVPNAERAFKDLKMAGYFPNNSLYCTLLDAYDKAGTAPYGFIDRMCADGAFPNEHVKTVVNKLHGT